MTARTPILLSSVLKEKQRSLRDQFPVSLGLRVHRAISWMIRADQEGDADVRFILLWIGFNAAYAGNIGHAVDNVGSERDAYMAFFGTLNGYDAEHRIYNAVWQRFSQEIRILLSNQYIFGPFWKHHNGDVAYADWRDRLERANVAVASALRRQDTTTVLSILFDRLYVLRNQLVHGGATFESSVNRAQVRDGCALLSVLMPVFVDLMMAHPEHEWRMPHYPVVE